MKNLAALKQYLPTILYSVLGIVILFMLYKLIMRLRAGGLAVGAIIADKAENQSISNQTGISTSRIQELRTVALNIAHELETLKDMSWWDRTKHVQLDSDTLQIMNNVKSTAEMKVVRTFYTNIFTNSNNLLTDLQHVLSASDLAKVPYVSALY